MEVSLYTDAYAALQALKAIGVHDDRDGEVLRDALFAWWSEILLAKRALRQR